MFIIILYINIYCSLKHSYVILLWLALQQCYIWWSLTGKQQLQYSTVISIHCDTYCNTQYSHHTLSTLNHHHVYHSHISPTVPVPIMLYSTSLIYDNTLKHAIPIQYYQFISSSNTLNHQSYHRLSYCINSIEL